MRRAQGFKQGVYIQQLPYHTPKNTSRPLAQQEGYSARTLNQRSSKCRGARPSVRRERGTSENSGAPCGPRHHPSPAPLGHLVPCSRKLAFSPRERDRAQMKVCAQRRLGGLTQMAGLFSRTSYIEGLGVKKPRLTSSRLFNTSVVKSVRDSGIMGPLRKVHSFERQENQKKKKIGKKLGGN